MITNISRVRRCFPCRRSVSHIIQHRQVYTTNSASLDGRSPSFMSYGNITLFYDSKQRRRILPGVVTSIARISQHVSPSATNRTQAGSTRNVVGDLSSFMISHALPRIRRTILITVLPAEVLRGRHLMSTVVHLDVVSQGMVGLRSPRHRFPGSGGYYVFQTSMPCLADCSHRCLHNRFA